MISRYTSRNKNKRRDKNKDSVADSCILIIIKKRIPLISLSDKRDARGKFDSFSRAKEDLNKLKNALLGSGLNLGKAWKEIESKDLGTQCEELFEIWFEKVSG